MFDNLITSGSGGSRKVNKTEMLRRARGLDEVLGGALSRFSTQSTNGVTIPLICAIAGAMMWKEGRYEVGSEFGFSRREASANGKFKDDDQRHEYTMRAKAELETILESGKAPYWASLEITLYNTDCEGSLIDPEKGTDTMCLIEFPEMTESNREAFLGFIQSNMA